jgi:hypothetical protein
MNNTTLGLAAVFIAAALVGTFAVATTPAFASKVRVGDTKNLCVTRADNGQHAAFGAGSTLDTATNTPTNTQNPLLPQCNVGSTGSG